MRNYKNCKFLKDLKEDLKEEKYGELEHPTDSYYTFLKKCMNKQLREEVKIENEIYKITLDVPGVEKEDIEIVVMDDKKLTIIAENEERNYKYKYNFSDKIDEDSFSINLENGVLYLEFKLIENIKIITF